MSRTSSSSHPQPQRSPDDAVAEVLVLYPKLESARDQLRALVKPAWRGEWPVSFFEVVAQLASDAPWLEEQLRPWIDPATLKEFSGYPPDIDLHWSREEKWKESTLGQPPRSLTRLSQFEGLLLLWRLKSGPGENETAHRLLCRVLDQVDAGLSHGRPVRLRRHPLKDVFRKVGRPQTIEQLAHSLHAILSEVTLLYPSAGDFLTRTLLPLACGTAVSWIPPPDQDESDALGTDKPATELSENAHTDLMVLEPSTDSGALIPAKDTRTFTPADLADEMAVAANAHGPHKYALARLSNAWRGEETWLFYQAVAGLAYGLRWLSPLLHQWIDPPALSALRACTRRPKGYLFSLTRTANWRERNRLEPRVRSRADEPFALIHRGLGGVDHLRGLLLLGMLEWGTSEKLPAQIALRELICAIESNVSTRNAADVSGKHPEPIHPLKPTLDAIASPKTAAALAAAIESLLPELAKLDAEVANLLGATYLPLLGAGHTHRFPDDAIHGRPPREPESKPKRRKRPARSAVNGARVHIPSRQVPLPGESIEETAPGRNVLQRSELSNRAIPLKKEIAWVHQRIYGSNQLLARNHIESLCDAEALIFARALDERIGVAFLENNPAEGWLGILTALTLITGQGVATWSAMEPCSGPETQLPHTKPQLLLREGIFRLPVVRPEGAFKPDSSILNLIEGTSSTVDLHLPPSLRRRIDSLLELGPPTWDAKGPDLRRSLEGFVAKLAPIVGTGISLARVRLVARARIRESTNDLAATMILCGDTFGVSTAPLYYACVSTASVEQAFRSAAWPLFGDHPGKMQNGSGARVGSELLLTSEAARALARSPGAPMQAASKKKRTSEFLVSDHNNLVNHVLCMLAAAAGHRPTSALLELSRFDFDTDMHAAVFKDKQCDPAHLFRFVPTADLVSMQIERYLEHLRGLAELPDIDPETVLMAREAVLGRASLFFHLQPSTHPLILELDTWRKSLPSNWQVLPLNWGRTWIASRGRDAAIDSDYLSITLGHLDAVGYPFSVESPLEPAGLSRAVSGALGRVARSTGWVARKGLGSDSSKRLGVQELGPLKDWASERGKLAELSKAYQVAQRQALRAALHGNRLDGEKIALASLEAVVQRPIAAFERLAELRKAQRSPGSTPVDSTIEEPVLLTAENVVQIQGRVDEASAHNKVLAIAGHNALHRYLKSACKLLSWECPIPSPWLAPATLEPTPFFPGLFRATSQLRAIRAHFGQIAVKAPEGGLFTPFEWACGQATIALCAFGFVDDETQVLEVLRGRKSGVRTKTIQDLLLVETGDERRVVGIRGLAAISVARLSRQFPNNDLPHVDRLNAVLAAQLPPALAGTAGSELARLCATISVTNIVELSGLARSSLDRLKGCVSMSTVRQRQMLEEGHGLVGPVPSTNSSLADVTVHVRPHKIAPALAMAQFKKLRDTLHIGDGPKSFATTGEKLSQANIGAFRNPLRRELKAFIAQDKLSPLVAYIAAFALHMTANGTHYKIDPAWVTVYGYITCFGSDLVELASGFDFINMEAEEYIDLFQGIIDCKGGSATGALAARELVNFHTYLQERHDFDVVDFSDLEIIGARLDQQVDAEVVQPQEYALGMVRLSAMASCAGLGEAPAADRFRTVRQAEVFALLLRPSGARLNELTALRFKDVLATPDSVVLLIRPSRYRRLKTSAARRVIDVSTRMTRHQRVVVSNWIAAEKTRLGAAWKPTLPILGQMGAPKDRASSTELRDITLHAMEEPVGYRTKIHRVRHLVAAEDMLAIWLTDADWRAFLGARVHSRRPVRGFRRHVVVLPRHIREQSLRFGHRRSSTTLANYFHMPWATTSRPHQALSNYIDSHSAAVALGSGSSNAYKIGYRANNILRTPGVKRLEPVAAWLTHVAGEVTPTPGSVIDAASRMSISENASRLSARIAERALRDIQRGLSPVEACLVHGLTAGQRERLHLIATEIQQITGFRIWPRSGESSKPRTARPFRDAKALEGILDLVDRDPSDADRQLMLSVSRAYLVWGRKGDRSHLALPSRESERLTQLLVKLGLSQAQVRIFPSPAPDGLSRIQIMRSLDPTKLMNHTLAWLLVVANIVATANEH